MTGLMSQLRMVKVANCKTCSCILDEKGKPESRNCGGDCLRCMAVHGEDPECIEAMQEIRKQKATKSSIMKVGTRFGARSIDNKESWLWCVVTGNYREFIRCSVINGGWQISFDRHTKRSVANPAGHCAGDRVEIVFEGEFPRKFKESEYNEAIQFMKGALSEKES